MNLVVFKKSELFESSAENQMTDCF